jgi:hypothetical protein
LEILSKERIEMSTTIKLEQWAIVPYNDGYTPPEIMRMHIAGKVFGHPTREDGEEVITSYIVETSGVFVKTISGTLYELGEPRKEYLEYLKEIGYTYNKEFPVRIIVEEELSDDVN